MLTVPLVDTPSQELQVTLNGQYCRIAVYLKSTGLYLDLYADDALVIGGVLCENANPLVRGSYLGFVGDLLFLDTEGEDDPTTPGLGARFLLFYIEAADFS